MSINSMQKTLKTIRVSNLSLDLKNPRLGNAKDELNAIALLCQNEKIFLIAQDIVVYGLNDMIIFGVMENDAGKYTVLDGNRRLCALKLLHDSSKAPADERLKFESLSKEWQTSITNVQCVIYSSRDEAKPWIERLHAGEFNGKGQKAWDAVQKSRFQGSNNQNAKALAFLDWAYSENLISNQDLSKKLTTVGRFISNPRMRKALKISGFKENKPLFSKPEKDVKIIAQKFIDELLTPGSNVHSRQNKANIDDYAKSLSSSPNKSSPTTLQKKPHSKNSTHKPSLPALPKHLKSSKDIFGALTKHYKLNSIYYSLCKIDLKDHTVLLRVGVWMFLETLTAATGRKDGSSLVQYINDKFRCDKNNDKSLKAAIDRIKSNANDSKHHKSSAGYDPAQLSNDWDILKDLILKLAKDIQ